jgi:hypothetical protein|tara:strand:+ start:1186 stop:1716 length:531 start_codon:yes stop_codon:yes gene_type:complete
MPVIQTIIMTKNDMSAYQGIPVPPVSTWESRGKREEGTWPYPNTSGKFTCVGEARVEFQSTMTSGFEFIDEPDREGEEWVERNASKARCNEFYRMDDHMSDCEKAGLCEVSTYLLPAGNGFVIVRKWQDDSWAERRAIPTPEIDKLMVPNTRRQELQDEGAPMWIGWTKKIDIKIE